uniref:Uncharacterized protein n=1 Tax=Triticum urartu TaxID=4572 RepID=A0A8R7TKP5_TRIUA
MGRLMKGCEQGTHDLSADDTVDSSEKPFIPDDYADDDCFKVSQTMKLVGVVQSRKQC